MSEIEMSTEMSEWLKTRPETIQKLAKKYPPGARIKT